jgi:hypothetical protein
MSDDSEQASGSVWLAIKMVLAASLLVLLLVVVIDIGGGH